MQWHVCGPSTITCLPVSSGLLGLFFFCLLTCYDEVTTMFLICPPVRGGQQRCYSSVNQFWRGYWYCHLMLKGSLVLLRSSGLVFLFKFILNALIPTTCRKTNCLELQILLWLATSRGSAGKKVTLFWFPYISSIHWHSLWSWYKIHAVKETATLFACLPFPSKRSFWNHCRTTQKSFFFFLLLKHTHVNVMFHLRSLRVYQGEG